MSATNEAVIHMVKANVGQDVVASLYDRRQTLSGTTLVRRRLPPVELAGIETVNLLGDVTDNESIIELGTPASAVNVLAGGETRADVVRIDGTPGIDTITLSGNMISDGGTTILLDNVEELFIDLGSIFDTLIVEPFDPGIDVTLLSGGVQASTLLPSTAGRVDQHCWPPGLFTRGGFSSRRRGCHFGWDGRLG